MDPSRRIVRCGYLHKFGKNRFKVKSVVWSHHEKCYFVLCNDIFICTLPLEGPGKVRFRYRWHFPVPSLSVQDHVNDQHQTPDDIERAGSEVQNPWLHAFDVKSAKKTYALSAPSLQEKVEWMEDFDAVFRMIKKGQDSSAELTKRKSRKAALFLSLFLNKCRSRPQVLQSFWKRSQASKTYLRVKMSSKSASGAAIKDDEDSSPLLKKSNRRPGVDDSKATSTPVSDLDARRPNCTLLLSSLVFPFAYRAASF